MRSFLMALVLSIAFAASLVVLWDRLQGSGDDASRQVLARLEALEARLAPVADGTRGDPQGSSPKETRSLVEMVARLGDRITDVEGSIFDLQRGLRADLKGVYERVLLKLEELRARSGPAVPAAAAKQQLRAKLAEMGVKVVEEEGMLEVRGAIGHPSQPLELLAAAPGGRVHETLLIMDVTPSALKVGLEDLGLTEVADPDRNTGKWPAKADGCYIYVLWDGLKKPRRAEDMILNTRTRETMQRTKWLFTASRFYTDTRTWERRFAADLHKNVVAVTMNHALDCILCCPLEDAADEHIWVPDEVGCPDPGTKVRIFLCLKERPAWDKV